MRTLEELQKVRFSQWTSYEICKAALDWNYPDDESLRIETLKGFLPILEKTLEEETQAYSEIKKNNSREPYLKEWKSDLDAMQDVLDRGFTFGMERSVWHSAGQICTKCGKSLVKFETAICRRCKNSGFRP